MKTQEHNQGELQILEVKIEKQVLECFEKMANNSEIPLADLVVIALKRFKAAHSDYMNDEPKLD